MQSFTDSLEFKNLELLLFIAIFYYSFHIIKATLTVRQRPEIPVISAGFFNRKIQDRT